MTDFRFELRPFHRKRHSGREGLVGAFGAVAVEATWRKQSIRAGSRQLEVRLFGDHMPQVVYRTVGPGRPTLRNARLTIDGHAVQLTFNRGALSNASRALKLQYQDRSYAYVAAKSGKGGALSRPGVLITLARRDGSTGKGKNTFGTVTGNADVVDLALAVLFEEIDTLELTTSGAVSGALNRLLNPRSNEPVTE
ncbi:hypothetical protein [Streptomyces boluensis]|uniref:Uncharacterized protein n=1 Tax=Streptomyces boluensis TaxID=1775135 RepID=A0A964UTB6_9ACTN|nr:hypothetical protein [Streptomyces boluensis]NBE54035.1 hypothetical protein [Streptomyces boluensis]